MTEHWRLIVDATRDGAMNMAIDEAILEAVGRDEAPPTLRLYQWEPACLSLGYAQRAADVDMARIEARGWHLVRRMTGGRAILHADELTYSVALPQSHPLAGGSIVDSYRRLSSALLVALNQIGLAANADKRVAGAAAVGPVCFEVPSDYEIAAGGKKLIGSAQVRKQNAALQHGSLPLRGDVSRICDALVFQDETARQDARSRVLGRATTLSDALGQSVNWDKVAQAVCSAFAATFSLCLDEAPLTPGERQRAWELRAMRYTNNNWNLRL
jgi:lipoate-protein ligase A